MSKLFQIKLLKKPIIQIIVSISLLALFLTQLPLFNGLLQYVDHHFCDAYSIKIFTYNTQRNFIFLVFNGILVLIIKNSGILRSPPENAGLEIKQVENIDQKAVEELSEKEAEVKKEEVLREEQGKEDEILPDVEDGETMHMTTEEESKSDENYEEEEEEEEEMEVVNSEELNKKCEDFIKMIREGIKNEFQQVVVHI